METKRLNLQYTFKFFDDFLQADNGTLFLPQLGTIIRYDIDILGTLSISSCCRNIWSDRTADMPEGFLNHAKLQTLFLVKGNLKDPELEKMIDDIYDCWFNLLWYQKLPTKDISLPTYSPSIEPGGISNKILIINI